MLLIKSGRVLLMKGYGLADLRSSTPITPWTRFEIASVSKTFTATALLMLQQRGLVSVDDDIRKFIPELPQYASAPIRIADMLHHVSGLPSYFDLKNVPMANKTFWVSDDYPSELARQARQFPQRFPTGRKYEYNNTNFLLMAVVIERISGKPFARFMRDEIFAPAGMVDTFIYDSPASVPVHSDHPCNNALGYEYKNKAWVETWGTVPARHEKHLEVGDGAVWSNLADMARWDAAIRANKFLTPDTMRRILVPSHTADGKTNPYGLGWALFMTRSGKVGGLRPCRLLGRLPHRLSQRFCRRSHRRGAFEPRPRARSRRHVVQVRRCDPGPSDGVRGGGAMRQREIVRRGRNC